MLTHAFDAPLEIIGVNPFVRVPDEILAAILAAAGRDRGPVPVRGLVQDRQYRQTLVRYRGLWRLYVNTTMLKDSPRRIGETLRFTITLDPDDRSVTMPPELQVALHENRGARDVFDRLPRSRQQEIVRYIAKLRSPESVARNVVRAIDFLNGKGRFVGRDAPE